MLIKMKETKDGSPDGIEVKTYEEGGSYDLPESLASVFIREEWAVRGRVRTAGPTEDKMLTPTRKRKNK